MIYETIKNCTITHATSQVLLDWIDDITSSAYRRNNHNLHAGIDISAARIYAPFNGVVIDVSKVDGNPSITLQYDVDTAVRICNLSELLVESGDTVLAGAQVARCEKFAHVEYLKSEEKSCNWIVRIGKLQLYKHDPRPLLEGSIQFSKEIQLESNYGNEQSKERMYHFFGANGYEGPRI